MVTFNQPVVCPILIGRTQDLAALRELREQAKNGQGRIALLYGEAGIGKSRLVAELKSDTASQGFLLLQGNCFQTDQIFPYAPFLDLFHTYFAASSLLADDHNLVPLVQEISRFLPDVLLLLPEHTPLVVSPPADPHLEKRRLFALVQHFFTRLAAHQPLLCIIEDLHWSDDCSLELLVHLARVCKHLPMLFVLTYRSDEVSPELRHVVAELDREHLAQDFHLQRLSRADVDAMLQAIFAMYQAVHSGLSESLYPLTEGNPFFVEEVLKSLLAMGEIVNWEGNWERTLRFGAHIDQPMIPRSVQDAVYQRTKLLSNPARKVLTLAAVAGRRFDLTILQQVMQIDEPSMLTLIKELIAAQLVLEENADQFSFRHALTRQAVYGELLLGERRALHRSIAETIEQQVSPSVLDAQLFDLAYHFFEGEVWLKAVEYGQRAGERALILYAPRAAIEHLTRTLDALKQLGRTPLAVILRARGQAYETIGSFERARSDYEQALAIAQQDRESLMEWQSLLDIGFLWAVHDYTQAGQWFQRALENAEGLGNPTLHARSLNRIGNWQVNIGRAAEGLRSHGEALALFETVQDSQGVAETFDLLGMAYGMYGDTVKSTELYRRAIALFRAQGDHHNLISSLTSSVVYISPFLAETTYSVCASLENCSLAITEALALARHMESLVSQAYVEWVAGGCFVSFGAFGRGLAHAQASLQIATEIQHTQWMSGAYFTLGRAYMALLEIGRALEAFKAGRELAFAIGSAWWIGSITTYLAQAYLLQGDTSRAQSVLEEAMSVEQQPRNISERLMRWAWGELALANNQTETALNIAESLLASAPSSTNGQAQPIPALLKLKGDALGRLMQHQQAIQVLEEARQGAIARQQQPLLWQIQRTLGRQYRHLKQEERARENFHLAREGIAALAHSIDDVYLREQFSRSALATLPKEKPLPASRAARSAYGGLTEREREIVILIAQGNTNPEIAQALSVTKRTIETHINNILYKLDLPSRAHIVVWTIEKGLTKPR